MKMVRNVIGAMALSMAVLGMTACGDDASKAVDEMCACKDMKCVTAVGKKYKDVKPSDALKKKLSKCLEKIMKP